MTEYNSGDMEYYLNKLKEEGNTRSYAEWLSLRGTSGYDANMPPKEAFLGRGRKHRKNKPLSDQI